MGEVAQGDLGVLRTLLHRRDAGSKPGSRADGKRLALVIEGGGMRGAYAGGMVHALERLGLRDSVDVVYGTSAGAFTATALVTRQAWGAARIFHEDLCSRDFIDYRRPTIGKGPLVSLDYLMEQVLTEAKPADWPALVDSDVPLRVVATKLPELEPATLGGFADKDAWRLALRATACIPVLAGPPVELEGEQWLDGSVTEPLAVRRALDEGATDVLALLSRSASEVPNRKDESPPMWTNLLEGLNPGLLKSIAARPRRYVQLARLLDERQGILGLRPAASAAVRALTIDSDRLRVASAAGSAAVLDAVADALGRSV